MRKKIAVDAALLSGNRIGSGVGRYVQNILGRLATADPCNRYYLFSPVCEPRFLSGRIRHVFLPRKREPYMRTIVNSSRWKQIRPDLFFSPHMELAFASRGLPPVFCTIHDIIPTQFLAPSFLLKGKTSFRLLTTKGVFDYLVLRRWLGSLKHVITGSQCGKNAIVRTFGERYREKISVVPEGVDPVFASANPEKAKRKCREIGLAYKKYLIYFGGHTVRKNLVRAAEAYQRLPGEIRREYPLVVVGDGYQKNVIVKRKLTRNVVFVPKLGDVELGELAAGAALSVYPSLLEGFGLPVVESLAAGVAPLVSDICTNRELLGADYPMFDPYDTGDIHRVLASCLNKIDECGKRVEKLQGRVREFDWEKTARRTVEILNAAAGD